MHPYTCFQVIRQGTNFLNLLARKFVSLRLVVGYPYSSLQKREIPFYSPKQVRASYGFDLTA